MQRYCCATMPQYRVPPKITIHFAFSFQVFVRQTQITFISFAGLFCFIYVDMGAGLRNRCPARNCSVPQLHSERLYSRQTAPQRYNLRFERQGPPNNISCLLLTSLMKKQRTPSAGIRPKPGECRWKGCTGTKHQQQLDSNDTSESHKAYLYRLRVAQRLEVKIIVQQVGAGWRP